MKRLGILSFQYYRLLMLYNLSFSTIGLFVSVMALGLVPTAFFMAKLVGYFASVGLYHFSAKQSYLYFLNTGYNMRPIMLTAWVIDTLVFFTLLTAWILIRLGTH